MGNPNEPDTLYCGVEPAALFKSTDAGETWALERGLFDHPHRPQWMPGGGGLCLHTILPDPANPERLFVAISTGGVYRTDDGGKTGSRETLVFAQSFLPPDQPVSRMGPVRAQGCASSFESEPNVFAGITGESIAATNSGDSWHDIGKGLPSDFGFAMEMDPHDANTVYIIPIESDEFRCTPEAKLRVYRTKNAGESWEPLTEGLPQRDAFETILRDGMKADENNPTGLYFGTRNGKLFGSKKRRRFLDDD